MAVAVKVAAEGVGLILAQGRPGAGNHDIIRQLHIRLGRGGVQIVHPLGKPAQLFRRADKVGGLLRTVAGGLSGLVAQLHRNGLFGLRLEDGKAAVRNVAVNGVSVKGKPIGVASRTAQGVGAVLVGRDGVPLRVVNSERAVLRAGEGEGAGEGGLHGLGDAVLVYGRPLGDRVAAEVLAGFKTVQFKGHQVSGGFALGTADAYRTAAFRQHLERRVTAAGLIFLVIVEKLFYLVNGNGHNICNSALFTAIHFAAQIAIGKIKRSRGGIDITDHTAAVALSGEVAQNSTLGDGYIAIALCGTQHAANISGGSTGQFHIADAVVDGQHGMVVSGTAHHTHQSTHQCIATSLFTGDGAADGAVVDPAGAAVGDLADQRADVIVLVDPSDGHISHLDIDDRTVQFPDQSGVDISSNVSTCPAVIFRTAFSPRQGQVGNGIAAAIEAARQTLDGLHGDVGHVNIICQCDIAFDFLSAEVLQFPRCTD